MKNKERTKTNRRFRKTLLSALFGITFISSTAEAAEYDISTDFSPIANPSGPWSYGAKTNLVEGFAPYEIRGTTSISGVPIEYWQLVADQEPTIYHNGTDSTATYGGVLNIPPGTVWMFGGINSSPFTYGGIRFTVPNGGTGLYSIETDVSPAYDGGPQGDTDYHVVRNDTELFGRFLTPTEGAGYTNIMSLTAGDSVDFLIGRGQDNNNFGSGLKTRIKIRLLPPPPSIDYDLSRDFSPTNNPNGVWSYGAKPSVDGPFSVFGVSGLNPFEYWQLVPSQEPTIYHNGTSNTITIAGGQGVIPPGTTFLYSGTDGATNPFGVARFTAPASSTYIVQAAVRPVYDGNVQGDTDFRVVKNGVEIHGQFLAPADSASYSNIVTLNSGDVLDLMVGRGQDNSGTASGLKIDLTVVPADGSVVPPSPLVVNGSFELGVDPGISSDVPSPDSATITGWTVENASVDYIGSRWIAGDGSRCLDLSGTDAATITQEIQGLTVGEFYRLSFLMAANPEVGSFTARLRAEIAGANEEFSFEQTGFSMSDLGWVEKTLDFTATSSSHKLSFISLNPGWAGPALDKVAIEVNPNIPPPLPPSGVVFDLSEGVSTNSNPNGPWTYGWASTVGGSVVPIGGPYYGSFDGSAKAPYWARGVSEYPAVYKNASSNTITAGGAAYAPGTVWFIPGDNGRPENFGVIRFTVPAGAAGMYVLGAAVAPAYTGGPQGDSDFHIAKNGVELFGRFLAPLEKTSYTNSLTLEDGDTVDFVIGRGADGNLYGSILRIAASLTATTNALPPFIIVQPQSQQLITGNNALLSVVAAATPPIQYQWRKGDLDLVDATNSTLALSSVSLSDAGLYSVVVANDFGSITSQVANVVVNNGPTIVRVVSAAASAEGQVELPLELVANGNENAIGFSLTFNPALLNFVDVAKGATAEKASLIVNTNELAIGRLGIAVALPAGQVFPEGVNQLLKLTFDAASATQSATASIGFSDVPVSRQVSDIAATILNATYTGGSVSIVVTGLEGDVAPRPGGDNTVTIIDWVQIGRYVAALDSATNGLEFQKADCAPRSGRGNGIISVSDWVQAGRYVAGLDPRRPAGGPLEPVSLLESAGGGIQAAGGRVLTIPVTNALPGTTVTLPVLLDASGTENALAFTLSFDAANLRFVGARKADKMSRGTLNVNTNLGADGKMGFAMALPAGFVITAGFEPILYMDFEVSASATGTGMFSFGDSPVYREIADVGANPLPSVFTAASVSFGPPREVGPPLTAARSGNSVLLFWPSSSPGFNVYTADKMDAVNWSKVPGTAVEVGGQWLITVPNAGSHQFFRLEKR